MKTRITTLLAIGLCVAAGLFVATGVTSSQAPPSTLSASSKQIRANIVAMLQQKAPIKVLPDIPSGTSGLAGGARTATNRDAAYFAWQEFIALNWPNVPVTGLAKKPGDPGARETADATKKFGQPPAGSPGKSVPALVWESTRHRAEIFTPPPNPSPSPYPSPAPTPYGYKPDATVSWGYNSTPGYVYPGLTVTSSSPSTLKTITPFVNLDEASQIGTCKMYLKGTEVLFMAKANYMEYGYVASRGWYNSTLLKNPASNGTPTNPVASYANTSGYIVTTGDFPTPGKVDGSKAAGPYVSLPNGTLEFKAAFRLATDAERKQYEAGQPITGGYHAAPIRYYRQLDTDGVKFAYTDAVGVLLSLHIIHKTPSAPYFIFATFEHKDDVLGTDGKPTEDADGKLNPNVFTSTTPSPTPTPPYVYPSAGPSPSPGQYLVGATTPNVFEAPSQFTSGAFTSQLFIPPPSGAGVAKSTTQSAYQNTRDPDDTPSQASLPAANSPTEAQSYITVNRRRFSIPTSPIVEVNQDIHNLIKMYGYKNPGGTSGIVPPGNVWLNYKLVNVQWIPAGSKNQKTPGLLYGNTSMGAKPLIPVESFYLSNSLVETNMILSAFSGQFDGNSSDGLSITDFYGASQTYTNNNASAPAVMKNIGDPFYNVYTKGGPYNMGGCMGCHGNTSVNGGSDASFILGHGRPFGIEGIDPPPQTMIKRFQGYFQK